MRRNDEVAAQRRRWTFYETIIFMIVDYPFDPVGIFADLDAPRVIDIFGNVVAIRGQNGLSSIAI